MMLVIIIFSGLFGGLLRLFLKRPLECFRDFLDWNNLHYIFLHFLIGGGYSILGFIILNMVISHLQFNPPQFRTIGIVIFGLLMGFFSKFTGWSLNKEHFGKKIVLGNRAKKIKTELLNKDGGRIMSQEKTSEKKSPFIGWILMITFIGLVFFLVDFWPTYEKQIPNAAGGIVTSNTENNYPIEDTTISKISIKYELRLLILVLLSGALGSFIHAATSYADYVGNEKYQPEWKWFYVLRIPIGSVLALIVFLIVQGGFLIMESGVPTLKPFGVMGFAALTGMFSRQAVDKLGDIFTTMFQSKVNDGREDKLKEEENRP